MRTLLIVACVISLLYLSCKKEQQLKANPKNAHVKKYAVKFKNSAFSLYNASVSSSHPAALASVNTDDTSSLITSGINKYFYVVYDSSGQEVNRISAFLQHGTATKMEYFSNGVTPGQPNVFDVNYITPPGSFDTITDSLAAGTYTVIILGAVIDTAGFGDYFFIDEHAEAPPMYSYSSKPLSTAFFNYIYLSDGPGLNAVDTYLYKGTITVGTQNVEQSFTLNRITGLLTANIEDALPANVGAIQMGIDGEYEGLTLDKLLPDQAVTGNEFITLGPYFPIGTGDVGKTNLQCSEIIINTVTPINVKIVAYDTLGNVFATRIINGVQMAKNEKTLLTGKLFDGPQTSGVKKSSGLANTKLTKIHF